MWWIGNQNVNVVEIYFLCNWILHNCRNFVFARRKIPAKRFKICHILYVIYTKTLSCFFYFSFCATLCNECPGPWRWHRPAWHSLGKLAWNKKWKKQLWVFVYLYIKYCKFWSISLELFTEHTPWNWQEWSIFVCKRRSWFAHQSSKNFS